MKLSPVTLIEFPESVNFQKSYFTKHSLQSEAILKSVWMRNGVASPECARNGNENELNSDWCKIRCTFSLLIVAKRFSLAVCLESLFLGVEERREEKIASGYARVTTALHGISVNHETVDCSQFYILLALI